VVYEGYKYAWYEPGFDIWRRPHGKSFRRSEELFDLKADPREVNNLVDKRPKVLERMRRLFRKVREEVSKPPPKDLSKSEAPSKIHLRLSADRRSHRLEGRIQVDGTIAEVKPWGPPGSVELERVSGDAIAFRVAAAGGEAGLDVFTHPADAEVKLTMKLDGKPLAKEQLYVGAFGLSLLEPPFQLDPDTMALAIADVPPLREPGRELGVFLWRDDVLVPVRVDDDDGPSELTDEMDAVMRDWGYVDEGPAPATLPADR
jgi:hypothetical protein